MALTELTAHARIDAGAPRTIGRLRHPSRELAGSHLEIRDEPRARRRDFRVVELLPERIPAAIAARGRSATAHTIGDETGPRLIELVGAPGSLDEESFVEFFAGLAVVALAGLLLVKGKWRATWGAAEGVRI